MSEFEALTYLANGPIIFMYYAESEISTSTIKYIDTGTLHPDYWRDIKGVIDSYNIFNEEIFVDLF